MNKPFAIQLLYNDQNEIQPRLIQILDFICKKQIYQNIFLLELEATGLHGEILSGKVEKNGFVQVSCGDIQKIFIEKGQIIDLHMVMKGATDDLQLIVADGQDINIVSNNLELLDEKVVGRYQTIDIKYFPVFNYPPYM